MDADRANDHLFDTTPTNSPPKFHQHTMRNGYQSNLHEHEALRNGNGASAELLQGSLHDKIYEEVEDDDRDNGGDDTDDDYDDDERYEHEFGFEDSKEDSYGAAGHRGWE